ncbi:hypothetical protein CRM22_010537 [Opisthorchis felineus]|uniref:t-SNARE coiled-coil homology domain-containing protein n=1 Tax=Opisthorchis felineus TaxID=147828 RepID=A0A4S2L3H7_OPIFE|nr:hypothetical protein CRM22_010537 [Opisthorchis felineus]
MSSADVRKDGTVGGGAGGGGKPTELELLRMRMNTTTDQSLEATRRIYTYADQAQKTGAATMEQLSAQGEQLRRVDVNMDKIHHDVNEADRNLQDLEKCCGLCVCPWKRFNKPRAKTYYDENHRPTPTQRPQSGLPNAPRQQSYGVTVDQPAVPGQGQYIQRILGDAREDEMEVNLQKTGQIVGQLHVMATEMNQEIRGHNEILERIDKKADANKIRIEAAQGRAEHILGKPASSEPTGPSQASIGMAAAKYMMK